MTSRAALALVACIAAPSALSFHQPYTPLRPHAAIAMRQPALIMRADRQEQPKAQRSSLRRKLDRVVTALTVGAASLMMHATPALAARKTQAPPPPQPIRISGTQKVLFGGTISGTFLLVTHLRTEHEAKEEKIRVKKESKKMQNMEKEFTDIDGGVDDDNDLMASLRKRMENSTSTDEEGGAGPDALGGGGPDDSPPPIPDTFKPPDVMDTGGGAAVLEPPSEGPTSPADEPAPGATEDDIERLKRMFGNSE
jgi:hypothetical protein